MTAIAPPANTTDSFERLWALSPDERAAAMYAGELSLNECSAWARRYPDQIPTLNGEFWFLAIKTPEVADHDS